MLKFHICEVDPQDLTEEGDAGHCATWHCADWAAMLALNLAWAASLQAINAYAQKLYLFPSCVI